MNDLKAIIEDAMEEAGSVLTEVFESLQAPPPSQDQLREAFRQAALTAEGMEAFRMEHGDEVFDRQVELALRRYRGDQR